MFSIFAIPWVRKLGEILLIFAALAGMIYAIYHKGVDSGEAQRAASDVEASKAELSRVEGTFQQQLTAQAAAVDQYSKLVGILLQKSADAGRQAQAAAAAGTVEQQKVAVLPDNSVQADLESKLGGSLSSPAILRLDDSIVTDYPNVKAQASALVQQVTALSAAGDDKDKLQVSTAAERDDAIAAYNELLPLYTQAYNAAVPRHRHWYCLFLCQSKPLKLPAPATLQTVPRK